MLRLAKGQQRTLAIGVNGTIHAVTRTFNPKNKPAQFAAMVPERVFVTGDNIIEIFDVTGTRPAEVFETGFESGNLSAWSPQN